MDGMLIFMGSMSGVTSGDCCAGALAAKTAGSPLGGGVGAAVGVSGLAVIVDGACDAICGPNAGESFATSATDCCGCLLYTS